MRIMKYSAFLIAVIHFTLYTIDLSDGLMLLNSSLIKLKPYIQFSHVLRQEIKTGGLRDLVKPSLEDLLRRKESLKRIDILAVPFDENIFFKALTEYHERHT